MFPPTSRDKLHKFSVNALFVTYFTSILKYKTISPLN